jgi:hypothetical protein
MRSAKDGIERDFAFERFVSQGVSTHYRKQHCLSDDGALLHTDSSSDLKNRKPPCRRLLLTTCGAGLLAKLRAHLLDLRSLVFELRVMRCLDHFRPLAAFVHGEQLGDSHEFESFG